jgi:hypothetical protein
MSESSKLKIIKTLLDKENIKNKNNQELKDDEVEEILKGKNKKISADKLEKRFQKSLVTKN